MKLCVNCYTENPDDEILCCKCDMGPGQAHSGKTATNLLKARKDKLESASAATAWTMTRTGQEPPITASGLVYLFGEQFADPRKGRLSGSQTTLVRSGQKVGSVSLAHSLFLAAFVSLAQQGHISLRLERAESQRSGHTDTVVVARGRRRRLVHPSLEREIMNSISRRRGQNQARAVVERVVSQQSRADAVKWTVGYVIDALSQAGYLDWTLEPGLFHYKVNRWADEDAVSPLAAEVQTLKDSLRDFKIADPYLYRRLAEDVIAGFGWAQWQEWLFQLLLEGTIDGIFEVVVP